MELARLRLGEVTAGVAGLVLLFDLFVLKWYEFTPASSGSGLNDATGVSIKSLPGAGVAHNGWNSLTVLRWIILLTIIVALGLAVITLTQRSTALPVSASVLATGMGVFTALLILYRIINQPGPNDLASVKLGAWLGLFAAVGVGCGGFQAMREEASGATSDGSLPAERRPVPDPSGSSAPPPAV
ncbi:MAG: hypothetical protein QOD76_390 [Solirubrobacteraceae bacterium]|jgi:hypothetical protein|nr:hypothetical protein [Solirubrobacteraceae bacterium]